MRKEIFMKNSFGDGVAFPLTFAFMITYLWYWSKGFNYTEIWK